MFMTANRLKTDGKPVLKLNIHEFADKDIPFLSSLGIDQVEKGQTDWRYILIHSQQDFLAIRASIFEKYNVLEEKGPQVFLEAK